MVLGSRDVLGGHLLYGGFIPFRSMTGRGHPYSVLSAHAEMTESRARRRGLRTGTGWDETPSAPRISTGGQLKFSSREWVQKLAGVELNEEDVARLVLDYFQVTERSEAAEEFIKEAGLGDSKSNERIHCDTHTSHSSSSAPSMLHNGEEDSSFNSPLSIPPGRRAAIRRSLMEDDDPFKTERMVNDVDPEILIRNPFIHLQLRLAQLVKLVDGNERTPAELLKFVQEEITPLTEIDDNNTSTMILEKAMMLITFGNKNSLYDDGFIRKLAEDVDGCILEHFDMSPTPLLTSIVKYMAMEQSKAPSNGGGDAICSIPQLTDLQRCTFSMKPNSQTTTSSSNGVATATRNGSGRSAIEGREAAVLSDSSSEDGMPFTALIRQGSIDDSSDDGTN